MSDMQASEAQTMVRTEVTIDGSSVFLAQDQDVAELKQRVVAAAATTGAFVDFAVVGNRSVSVLITAHTHVVIVVATVPFDPRETGDEDWPFGGFFDLMADLD